MWIDPVRRRTRLRRRWRKRAEWGWRDERAVEAGAEIVLRWWGLWWLLLLLLLLLLVWVGCGVGLSCGCCCLGLAQLDGSCECGGWRRERVAVGGFSCVCRDLRLLRIV